MTRPLIGITTDGDGDGRLTLSENYVRSVVEAGGLPVLLPQLPELVGDLVARLDGVLLTGGDDPIMEVFGVATHAAATRVTEARQRTELALLAALDASPRTPAFGICLGMQYMALHAGGALDQHLLDSRPDAARHQGDRRHPVAGSLGAGEVTSRHHQAVADPGRLEVAARADDGVIEAIVDPTHPFRIGVQWHPERTSDPRLGADLFRRFVAAARDRARP